MRQLRPRSICVLILLLVALLFPPGCSPPDPVPSGSDQAAATLDSGVVDLLRLAGRASGDTDRRHEEFRRALEQSEHVVREYGFDGRWPLEGWEAWKDCGRFLPRDGILEIEATGDDFQMAVPPDFDCALVQRVLIQARVSHGNRGHLFWMTEDQPSYDGERSIQYWLHPGDEFRTYTIEVGEHRHWTGRITGLRLDPVDKKGRVEIDSVVFMAGLNRLQTDLLAARCGLPEATVRLGDDRRPVLATTPGHPVHLDLAVPPASDDASPELRFAIGLAATGPDGRAAVPRTAHRYLIRSSDGRTIFDQVLDPAAHHLHGGWQEWRVPLERSAGRALGFIFSVEARGDTGDQDCCALFANPLLHPAGGTEQPNVLVILVDALRADRLGCYGHPAQLTPHLDRLCRESILFRHAQVSSSWTAPSVASLFTGLHPYQHGVRYVDTLELAGTFETVAERFRDAGWFTGAVSDNLLITPANGFDQGFRTFVSKPPAAHSRKAGAVTDLALSWLEHHGDRPFFLYLHYMDPHANYQPRKPFHPGPVASGTTIRPFVERGQAGGVVNRMQANKRFRLTPAEERRLLELYEGEIAATDYEVGRLLARLEQTGLAGGTVVVFVADHGEEFDDHGKYTHANSLFDELVRVPMLVRLPTPRQRVDQVESVVCTTDLGPTLLALAGAEGFASDVDARDFSGMLGGGEPAPDPREAYFEINPYSRNPMASGWIEATRGVRFGRLKLLYELRSERYRLYDLVTDPGERRSLFQEREPRSMEMAARLSRYLDEAARAEEEGGPGPGLLEDRQLQQLDALGYLDR